MKEKIHPKYNEKAKITCACGNSFEVGSTEDEMQVEICSACHPLYTGKSKVIDAAGRIDKFKEKIAKAKKMQDSLKKSKAKNKNSKPKSKKS